MRKTSNRRRAQEEYALTSEDVELINWQCRLFGGYLNIHNKTFNARIGPKKPIDIIYKKLFVLSSVERITLVPDLNFGVLPNIAERAVV